MKRILLVLWQLPQAVLGAMLFLFVRKKSVSKREGVVYVVPGRAWGVSLYPFIFLHDSYPEKTFYHEMGHAKQSFLLGPLYLVVVGLPSIVRAIVWIVTRRTSGYYEGYPERWADKLGGVER